MPVTGDAAGEKDFSQVFNIRLSAAMQLIAHSLARSLAQLSICFGLFDLGGTARHASARVDHRSFLCRT